jgi:hypothetical protein
MLGRLLRSALIVAFAAGCSTPPPPVGCTNVPLAECEAAVKAVLPLLSPSPDRIVVGGSAPGFVVVGCSGRNARVADVLITDDADIDAGMREHGPDISHLCSPNVSP